MLKKICNIFSHPMLKSGFFWGSSFFAGAVLSRITKYYWGI